MKLKSFSLTIFTLLAVAFISCAQPFNKAKLDSLLDLLAEKNRAMGSLAILKDGNIIYARAIGYKQMAPQPQIASDILTTYRIGSISKMFTATIVFQLIEEGKLELSATLDKFYPTVANANLITIGNMLSHRSGIHSFTDDSMYLSWSNEPKTHDEIIKLISAYKPDFEPNAKTAYSNSNFVLLGYIIEKICSKPYADLLQERICSRIGLKNTYYGGKTDVSKNESFSFMFDGSWKQQPETDMSIPHGAGSVVSTSGDLVQFIYALFTGKLVNETSLNSMKTITDGLGMGMMKFPYDERVAYGHGGAIDGFNSILIYLPDDKLSVAYCSNGTRYSINDILIGALNIYYNKPYSMPVFTAYKVTQEELEQYVGVYSCPQIPIKVTITAKDGILYGQGTGQPVINLEPTARHVFSFERAGIIMTFDPEKHEFLLEQGGGKFTFTKEQQ